MKKLFRKRYFNFLLLFLVCAFALSLYFCKDFYKTMLDRAQGYYWIWQGDKHYKNREIHKAIVSYRYGIRLHPTHYRAKYNLANIYVMYEDYLSATEQYRAALEVNPYYQNARINYAIVLANALLDYDRAIEEYNIAIEKKPKKWSYVPFIVDNKSTFKHNTGVAYYNLGIAWRKKSLLATNNPIEARECLENSVEAYNKALEIKKDYETYYNLALVEHLLGNYINAGDYYCKAIEISPLNYEAHYGLALMLRTVKKYTESYDEFRKAGLILDANGEGDKTRHIYDMLNNTMVKIVAKNDYNYLVQHIQKESDALTSEVTYVNGVLVVSDELDKAMFENFRKCSLKEYHQNKKKGKKKNKK